MAKKSRLIISIIIILGGLALVSFVSYKSIKENSRNKQIEKEIESLQEEAKRIQKDNKNLEERIDYFETEEFKEREAKEKLNFQREDEKVVVVRPSPSQEMEEIEVDNQEDLIEDEIIPNYKRWWNMFFKY